MANKKPMGKRANTRYSFRGEKLSLEKLLLELNVNDKVMIKPNGRYHSGLPFRRFAGHVGVVEKKAGKTTYLVYVPDMKKRQKIGVAHLKLLSEKKKETKTKKE